jgi:chlorite dismutase
MTVDRREVPDTREGWYVLHDFRTVDWDAWREATGRDRDRAVEDAGEYMRACADAEEGEFAAFSVLGHEADLMFVHLRPTLESLSTAERAFERTDLAGYTDRSSSYVSVAEVSSYTTDTLDPEEIKDAGLARYIGMRLKPSIPDADYACFYPMDKRRDPEYNWYDLPFEERADLMRSHGEIGRQYGGKVTQIVAGSMGFDDHEWGVTLFANDPTDIKDILYEMRFDPSSSKYAEFGSFYMARRFEPTDENVRALLAGEIVPVDADATDPTGADTETTDAGAHDHDHDHAAADTETTDVSAENGHAPETHTAGTHDDGANDDGLRDRLADLDVYAGQPHGEDVHAVVVYSEADGDELFDAMDGLRSNFDHYDTHVKTALYETTGVEAGDSPEKATKAVASVWDTASAADTAAGFLADLPGVVRQAGDDPQGGSWGTMGMFYTVKSDYREDFVEKFGTVGTVLSEMDGHLRTSLLANRENDDDMFIASRWESREDAMGFFRSEDFRNTVDWGRDVLADRPRHVFLA